MKNIFSVLEQFNIQNGITQIKTVETGNINDTYLITTHLETEPSLVLQKINRKVFSQPEFIMENIRTLQKTYQEKISSSTDCLFDKWNFPKIIPTKSNKDYFIDEVGEFWRAISYIPNSYSTEKIESLEQAKETGRILGLFHSCFANIDINTLKDTLPNFHITPFYLNRYDSILKTLQYEHIENLSDCYHFIEKRRESVYVLEDAKIQKKLTIRVIHGDPKISNILFKNKTNLAISIIDLDTIKPGLIHYDIGDCLRSACNSLGEETESIKDVQFNINIFKAILGGYFPITQDILKENDYLYIHNSIWLMTFELGLRFFTDFLEGDIYFKTEKKNHNLHRARVQFKLAKSIEEKENEIKDFIRKFL